MHRAAFLARPDAFAHLYQRGHAALNREKGGKILRETGLAQFGPAWAAQLATKASLAGCFLSFIHKNRYLPPRHCAGYCFIKSIVPMT
ncbi:hypothetical protein [Hymenobacter nivis]|uniref:Uncharacterized protein n=1 Tax=Hymenobacter nivis TaxID=1850093 RepID=A0A2Z3GH65_9BACT|nr:hypothetical protein [Hymenobacter nivis]AWM32318.1 hypothetical protein DDQ68_05635 [Hymenobacter nivis]